MDTEQQNKEGVPVNLRKQLAVAVKSIQWSYAIFWSISSREPGELEWIDGYYNGDVKTRKTVHAVQLSDDELGLQRTEQLRELYESLSGYETNPLAKRSHAALSPEDLTDTEWYFLICMSFVFDIRQGLPGRTLADNETTWLCNAHFADTKVFSRSLLAKSASIQTVVCFPYLGGVIELGTTDLVLENPNIIQQITSFLDFPCIIVSSVPKTARNDKDFNYIKIDQDFPEANLNPNIELEEVNVCSLNNSSNEFEPSTLQAAESFLLEGINDGAACQAQSCHFIDDDINNHVHSPLSSSDQCVPQTLLRSERLISLPKERKVNNDRRDMEPTSFDFGNNDIQYQSILSTILKSSHQLIMGPYFQNSNKESSFVSWKKGGFVGCQKSQGGASQRLLKKVVSEVAPMHDICFLESREDNGRIDIHHRPDAENEMGEKRGKGKLNDRFDTLGSIIPSTGKVDKVSILDGTIEYLKNLEGRIEELESQKKIPNMESSRRMKPCDVAERTDNYGEKRNNGSIKRMMNKRKACDLAVNNQIIQMEDEFTDDVNVRMVEKNVLIEFKCLWREGLLLEVMDALRNLHLDSHSIQSSTIDGNLSLVVKSKVKGSTVVSIRMIREALQRVTRKC